MIGPHVVSEAVGTSGEFVGGIAEVALPLVSIGSEALSDGELRGSGGGHVTEQERRERREEEGRLDER